MSISLTPEQIRDLARQINETIRGLTDIDAILDATRDDLRKAQRLKERADQAKYGVSMRYKYIIGLITISEKKGMKQLLFTQKL